jgi:long-subunit fatty acid transport protein
MTLAAGVYERYDLDYDYYEEVRDPDVFSSPRDALLSERTIAVEGLLRSVTAGYGAEIFGPIRLGFSAHYYFGNVDMTRKETDYPANTSETMTIQRDLDGWGWTVGAQGIVNDHLDLAVSYEGAFSVSGAHRLQETDTSQSQPVLQDVTTQESIDYPGTLRFGATYRPQNRLRTTFSAEGVWRDWSNLKDSFRTTVLEDTFSLRDTWDLRLGLEHVFYNGMPLRFGFRYLENYADTEAKRSIYSAGLGYVFAGTRFDVTALYHRQTSRQPFLFDPSRPGFPAPNSDVKVEDSVLQLVFGINRTF